MVKVAGFAMNTGITVILRAVVCH